MSTALVWFRRDLRLADNAALRAAVDRHDHVVPVFVHAPDEEGDWAPGGASRWWWHHALAALDESLAAAGAPVVLRRGGSLVELRKLAKTVKADAVYWNRLYDPLLVERDTKIKAALREDGVEAESFAGHLLFEPHQLKTGGGGPYRVFTPFWRNVDQRLREEREGGRAPLPTVRAITPSPLAPKGDTLTSLGLLPKLDWAKRFPEHWTPGEVGAQGRLDAFCRTAITDYRKGRDFPAIDATSGLSPHLHRGEISPLTVVARVERLIEEDRSAGVRANAEWFLREVGWREFAHHLLFHFPQTPTEPLYEKFAKFPWRRKRDYAADLEAWQRGRTGVPIVDAGMRQLWETGWMHNRVRMIVASFLTKNLLIPWQEGAAWFWDTLVDADLANNTLGWQWVAGCGADASPYFRIFNAATQSAKFDAEGAYIRTFVPELAKLDDDSIHAPWEAKPAALKAADVALGRSYVEPIADLKTSRERALAAYGETKD